MDKPTIGLSGRFQSTAPTVLSATTSATGAKKTVFAALDWKIKMVVLLLISALLYFLVVRFLKRKGKVSGKGDAGEEKKDKDIGDKTREKS